MEHWKYRFVKYCKYQFTLIYVLLDWLIDVLPRLAYLIACIIYLLMGLLLRAFSLDLCHSRLTAPLTSNLDAPWVARWGGLLPPPPFFCTVSSNFKLSRLFPCFLIFSARH